MATINIWSPVLRIISQIPVYRAYQKERKKTSYGKNKKIEPQNTLTHIYDNVLEQQDTYI
jgi:hypothetical protein